MKWCLWGRWLCSRRVEVRLYSFLQTTELITPSLLPPHSLIHPRTPIFYVLPDAAFLPLQSTLSPSFIAGNSVILKRSPQDAARSQTLC